MVILACLGHVAGTDIAIIDVLGQSTHTTTTHNPLCNNKLRFLAKVGYRNTWSAKLSSMLTIFWYYEHAIPNSCQDVDDNTMNLKYTMYSATTRLFKYY